MANFITLTIISIVFCLMLALQIRSKFKQEKRYLSFVLLMLSLCIWSVFSLYEMLSPIQHKPLFAKLSYLGIVPTPILWLFFSLEYSNKHISFNKVIKILVFSISSLILLSVLTNQYHGLFWTDIHPSIVNNNILAIKYERGIFYYINTIYSYIMLSAGFIIVLKKLFHTKTFSDFFLIFSGVSLPIAVNIGYLLRLLEFDYTPAAFSFTCFCFAWAILSGLFDTKMAISQMIYENMEEGILLIDETRKLTGMNPCAKTIFGIDSAISENSTLSVNSFLETIKPKLLQNSNDFFETQIEIEDVKKWYGVHVYSMEKKNKIPGWIVSLFDITEKKASEETLRIMDGLLSGTTSATSILLDGKNYEEAVYESLQIIGHAARADRIFLFQNSFDEETSSNTTSLKFHWSSDSHRTIDNLKHLNIPFEEIPFIIEPLSRNEVCNYITNNIKNEHLRNRMSEMGIFSLLALPMFVRHVFWGFLVFQDCTMERIWNDAEEAVLKSFVNSLSRAIEKGMVEKELEEGRKAAESANIAKSSFLANMSHEIRTPMNGIIGFIELISLTSLTKEQSDFLKEIKNGTNTLLYMLNDILDFSKIEAEKMELENIEFNIINVVEDALCLFSPNAFSNGIELNCEIKSNVQTMVKGDPGRLTQVLNNLIGNAVKFTNGGEISVLVEEVESIDNKSLLKFEVLDTGIGISPDVQKSLFKPFIQADSSTTRKYGGTGLGLAICKKIVEKMGGTINVQSKENTGTMFSFTIIVEKINSNNQSTTHNLKGFNILIVDQNATSRRILQQYLEETQCIVFEAQNEHEALNIIKTSVIKIDIAIINHSMQGFDGIKLGHTIRNNSTNNIKLILTSSGANRKDSQKAQEQGFSGYIPKPFRKNDLINTLSSVALNNTDNDMTLLTKIVEKEDHLKKNKSVLLVEDTEANRKLATIMLNKIGIDCEIAVNGKEAVDACVQKKYDLIFMDCQMPIIDGYEATKIIKGQKGLNSSTPIVAMTANALKGDAQKCYQSGMDDYITKPINMEMLKGIKSKWLEK